MAKRNPGGRTRSRKRRPGSERSRAPREPRPPREPTAASAPAAPRSVGVVSDLKALGERPQAPWHPFPLSELLILIGIIAAVVAWVRGYQGNAALLGAGIAAVVIGTGEVSLREHLGGFRPHTTMLAVIPAVAFHTVVVLAVLAIQGSAPRWLNYVLLPLDAVVVIVCFRVLRARFNSARSRRVAAGRR